jgi:hypothetical protein
MEGVGRFLCYDPTLPLLRASREFPLRTQRTARYVGIITRIRINVWLDGIEGSQL